MPSFLSTTTAPLKFCEMLCHAPDYTIIAMLLQVTMDTAHNNVQPFAQLTTQAHHPDSAEAVKPAQTLAKQHSKWH